MPTDDEWAKDLANASYKHVIDMGILSRLIIGGFAAPPAMYILQPQSAFALLAMSIVAGSAGTGIFRALQDWMQTVIEKEEKKAQAVIAEKEKELVQVRTQNLEVDGKFIIPKLEDAITEVGNLESKLREQSVSDSENPSLLKFPQGATLSPHDFGKGWTYLNEAKGINPLAVDKAVNAFKVLEQEVYSQSKSERGTSDIMINKNAKLDIQHLNQVKKLLREAKGALEAINHTQLPSGNDNTSQPEFNSEKNGIVGNSSVTN